jgi:hypothetical protein
VLSWHRQATQAAAPAPALEAAPGAGGADAETKGSAASPLAPRVSPAVPPAVDIRRFLRPTSSAELATVRKMSSLSAFAYFIPSVTVRGGRNPATPA